MNSAKDIIVKPISSQDAARIVKACHYSGKVVQNSQLHFGVFLNGRCGGAMQFGPSLDKRRVMGLVEGTEWNGFLELNRMAFADWLPRNSESRAIAVAMRIIRKNYPWVEWVLSFADGTQCGDGTIYRASGFVLTGIKANTSIWAAPTGEKFTDVGLRTGSREREKAETICKASLSKGKRILDNGGASMRRYIDAGFRPLLGFQLRYIYFLNPAAKSRLTVPILPFSEIERRGAGMYLGKPKRVDSMGGHASGIQSEEGGSTPTSTLQPEREFEA